MSSNVNWRSPTVVTVIGVSVAFLLALIVVITLLDANRSGAINTLTGILTFVSVIVAIAALVIATRQLDSAKSQLDSARSQEETARRQEKTVRRQEETARETARRQEVGVAEWNRDLRAWASEVINVLSEVVYASDDMSGAAPSDMHRYKSRLSALADRGRFFLPNRYTPKYDPDNSKPPAFRGSRHPALGPVVAAVKALDDEAREELKEELYDDIIDYVIEHRRGVIRELQREFVSYIQQILDPKGHNEKLADLIEHSEKKAKEREEEVKERTRAISGLSFGPGATALLAIVVERLRRNKEQYPRSGDQ